MDISLDEVLKTLGPVLGAPSVGSANPEQLIRGEIVETGQSRLHSVT